MPDQQAAYQEKPPLAPLKIGAHVSVAGGLPLAVERAAAIRAAALQIWVDQPQRFPRAPLPVEALAALREALASRDLPAYVHVPYLANLGTSDRVLRRRSIDMLARALEACRVAGLRGAVAHPGSHLGLGYAAVRARMLDGLRQACERADAPDLLLLENAAGAGGQVGASLDELADLIAELDAADIVARVCVDLQHAHAAIADLSTPAGAGSLAEALRASGVGERVALVHANDSAAPAGSRRDLHANPGEGTIGARGLRALSRLPPLARAPWILEVPGPERKGPGRAEVSRLRRIVR